MSKTPNTKTISLQFLKQQWLWLASGILLLAIGVFMAQQAAKAAEVVVYKSPTCGCCKKWVNHMAKNGYSVVVHNVKDVNPIKDKMGIPGQLRSCHTAKIGNYFIEGHVPAQEIKRLLQEKPDIAGLTVPGMPLGSPGMEGHKTMPYDVLGIQHNGSTKVFAKYNQR